MKIWQNLLILGKFTWKFQIFSLFFSFRPQKLNSLVVLIHKLWFLTPCLYLKINFLDFRDNFPKILENGLNFGQIFFKIWDIFLNFSDLVAKSFSFCNFDPQIVIFDPMFRFENQFLGFLRSFSGNFGKSAKFWPIFGFRPHMTRKRALLGCRIAQRSDFWKQKKPYPTI